MSKPMPMFAGINVTPMVDVILVLLIVYMVTIPLVATDGLVTLPKAVHPRVMSGANRDDAIVVAISRDGRIYLRSEQTTPALLRDKVKAMLKTSADSVVYVKGDARARFRDVANAVDQLRDAGAAEIGLLAEQTPVPGEGNKRSRNGV